MNRDILRPLIKHLREEAAHSSKQPDRTEPDQLQSEALWENVRILVDYSQTDPSDWAQDGFAFGRGPMRPGSLRLSDDASHPIAGVHIYGAARRDPLWTGLKSSDGTEVDAGALAKIPRSGQTLCTPTFEIQSGTIQYLVKGAAKVQAVVDSHRLIAGPLHGSLIKSVKAENEPQWITHRLQRYVGHRAHLELVPEGDGELELFMVVESESKPPVLTTTEFTLAPTSPAGEPSSPESVAAALQRTLASIVGKLLDADASWEPAEASLADWMLRHKQLFIPANSDLHRQLTELARLFFQQRTELAEQIRKRSRTAIAIWDGTGEDETLLIRGSTNNPGELVPRRLLEGLVGHESPEYKTQSGRLELAQQMVDAKSNPFISRVIVNRVWHHLFGKGIVTSPDNFGVLGRLPTHPELLDHMAANFVAQSWSIKGLIRELVLSRTYQMSSQPLDALAERQDPNNVLLHRMPVRRLEGRNYT